MGGTLSKLVYFEQTRKSRKVEAATNKRRFVFFDKPRQTALKRSQSLESLNTPRWAGERRHDGLRLCVRLTDS